MRRLAITLSLLLALPAAGAAENTALTTQDKALLRDVLTATFGSGDGYYTVVEPETELPASATRQYLIRVLGDKAAGVPRLIDQLLSRNLQPARLTLKSSPDSGCVFDDHGRYSNHFASRDCKKWLRHHPDVHGLATVSLPAYDEKTGLLLVFISTRWTCEDGAREGYILLVRRSGWTVFGKAVLR